LYLCARHCPIPPLLLFSVYLFVVEPLAACSLFSHTRAIAVDVFPCEQFEDAPLQSEMGESDYDGPDDENYKQKKPTVMRLLRFGKPELPLVISATFLASISAFLHMSQNIFVGMVINAVHYSSLNAGKSAVTTFTLYLLCIYVADCMLTLFSSVLYTIAATRCSCRLRTLVLRNMLRQDVAFFDTVRVGELLNRLSTDTEVIQMVVTANLAGWFIPLCQVVIGLIAIFTYNWKLTLVVLSLIPVIAVCMFLQGFCMKILTEQELIALADAGSKADETLSNIRTVRSYVMEEKEISHYADKINISYLIIKRRAWIAGGLSSITNLAGDSCILVAMWYGGQLIFQNQMSVGGLVSYMLFALQSVFAFSSLISIFPQFMEAIGASGRIFELLDRVPAVNYDGGFIAPNGIEGHIKFQDVHFHYPSRPKIKIMNGLSVDLPPGKTLALVGASGCGKSTFIYLLERFYDCQGGSILIDNMDILKYDPQWLRDQAPPLPPPRLEPPCSLSRSRVPSYLAFCAPGGAGAAGAGALRHVDRGQHHVRLQDLHPRPRGAGRPPGECARLHPGAAAGLRRAVRRAWCYAFRWPEAAHCHRACPAQGSQDPPSRRGHLVA
jgi:ABC-type multidrug transport system fused ATPase/permease subunit